MKFFIKNINKSIFIIHWIYILNAPNPPNPAFRLRKRYLRMPGAVIFALNYHYNALTDSLPLKKQRVWTDIYSPDVFPLPLSFFHQSVPRRIVKSAFGYVPGTTIPMNFWGLLPCGNPAHEPARKRGTNWILSFGSGKYFSNIKHTLHETTAACCLLGIYKEKRVISFIGLPDAVHFRARAIICGKL